MVQKLSKIVAIGLYWLLNSYSINVYLKWLLCPW